MNHDQLRNLANMLDQYVRQIFWLMDSMLLFLIQGRLYIFLSLISHHYNTIGHLGMELKLQFELVQSYKWGFCPVGHDVVKPEKSTVQLKWTTWVQNKIPQFAL